MVLGRVEIVPFASSGTDHLAKLVSEAVAKGVRTIIL